MLRGKVRGVFAAKGEGTWQIMTESPLVRDALTTKKTLPLIQEQRFS
jgi:hypothetical protein